MSAVELAIKKVKKLSARQARELVQWLDARNGYSLKKRCPRPRRSSGDRSIGKLKAWHNAVRGTTDWEPPKMPDDLVQPPRL